jgi:hypothetical protein
MDSTEEARRRPEEDHRRSQQTQMRLVIAAAGILLALGTTGHAQQQIEWKQTVSTPRGLNLPRDVKGDILGIELGDTYGEAKPKLQKLLAEAVPQPKSSGLSGPAADLMGETEADPIRERVMQFRLDAPGGFITASYVGEVHMTRMMKGSTPQNIRDVLELRFSAPSSGHQLVSIKRTILYDVPSDQPRVADLVALLKAKFKAEPQRVTENKYRFQFDDGRVHTPAKVDYLACRPVMAAMSAQMVPEINRTGDCDVVMEVDIGFGISKDHVKRVDFVLSDNERIKLNAGADYAYFDSYVRDLQSRTKGNPPKL